MAAGSSLQTLWVTMQTSGCWGRHQHFRPFEGHMNVHSHHFKLRSSLYIHSAVRSIVVRLLNIEYLEPR